MTVKLKYKETEFEVTKKEDSESKWLDVWYDDSEVMLKYTIDFEYPEPELYDYIHGQEEEEITQASDILWDTFDLAIKHFGIKK